MTDENTVVYLVVGAFISLFGIFFAWGSFEGSKQLEIAEELNKNQTAFSAVVVGTKMGGFFSSNVECLVDTPDGRQAVPHRGECLYVSGETVSVIKHYNYGDDFYYTLEEALED